MKSRSFANYFVNHHEDCLWGLGEWHLISIFRTMAQLSFKVNNL